MTVFLYQAGFRDCYLTTILALKTPFLEPNKTGEASHLKKWYFRWLLEVIFSLFSLTVITVSRSLVQCSYHLNVCLVFQNFVQRDIFVFNSNQLCSMIELFHMMLSNVSLVAFHYKSYGTFLILKKPYNSTVELPTTEIIEPLKDRCYFYLSFSLFLCFLIKWQ